MEKRINLFITEQGSVVKVEEGRLVIKKGSERLIEVPLIHLRHVVLFGNSTITPRAVSKLLKEGVFITFLTKLGKFQGTILPAVHPDGLIRKIQVMRAEDPSFRTEVAREIVATKIHNSVNFLKTRRKNRVLLKENIFELIKMEEKLKSASSLDQIRGIEGISSRIYFSTIQNLFVNDFSFGGRKKHPSPDPVNALLSLSYTLLYSICFSFLHINGLDPFIGFFHEMKRGHASLASDLVEEFRVPFCDSLILRLLNQGYFSESSFLYTGEGVFLEKNSLKRFLKEFSAFLDGKVISDGIQLSRWHLIEHQVRKFRRSIISGEPYTGYKTGETNDEDS